jgi:hypothetical protein
MDKRSGGRQRRTVRSGMGRKLRIPFERRSADRRAFAIMFIEQALGEPAGRALPLLGEGGAGEDERCNGGKNAGTDHAPELRGNWLSFGQRPWLMAACAHSFSCSFSTGGWPACGAM